MTGPVTGVLADGFGCGAVFLVGSVAAALAFIMVAVIARADRRHAA